MVTITSTVPTALVLLRVPPLNFRADSNDDSSNSVPSTSTTSTAAVSTITVSSDPLGSGGSGWLSHYVNWRHSVSPRVFGMIRIDLETVLVLLTRVLSLDYNASAQILVPSLVSPVGDLRSCAVTSTVRTTVKSSYWRTHKY